ncbi:hypothetical protein OGAPHI_000139 [Ogataea philodendri]|uniref:Uncharacterized protein n=1 Tax=Ogataea philodendri TaxID=1378263 RepID=A0A9P8PGP1_9ASCO|nr:uncharacterized protein OGAPHI_000139 [Ogataea philodendri]KAH3671953.1 hypothetical protein OGAPHI_000139 [Ogataea philodendri]
MDLTRDKLLSPIDKTSPVNVLETRLSNLSCTSIVTEEGSGSMMVARYEQTNNKIGCSLRIAERLRFSGSKING